MEVGGDSFSCTHVCIIVRLHKGMLESVTVLGQAKPLKHARVRAEVAKSLQLEMVA